MASRATHPIVYVRGFAMSRGEIDETTADPFCGFNVGSTVYRATPDRKQPPRKFFFQSPVVRLARDFGYNDVYLDGEDLADLADKPQGVKTASIVIYRYYDSASTLFGDGKTPPMKDFGIGLSELIWRVRKLICANAENALKEEDFRCYLVAHSMGGLVCRTFLQNPDCDPRGVRACVDKFFTYATPHNGIDMAGVNVPEWMTLDRISNFSRETMAGYLNLKDVFDKNDKAKDRVDLLPDEAFPIDRVFCLIGTNRSDYEVAEGLSRTFVGHGSDGLVRIENAVVCGTKPGAPLRQAAKAFVYRSHSGFYGIVNSEEGYQNLTRFLFGDVRIEVWLELESLTLPPDVQAEADKGRQVDALYEFELLASPRGKLWYLTRRIAEEDSVACVRYADWTAKPADVNELFLSTVFLSNAARVNKDRTSIAYSATIGARVPDYEVERKLWVNEHFEGGYLFRDSLVIEMTPPPAAGDDWTVAHTWQATKQTGAIKFNPAQLRDPKGVQIQFPFKSQDGAAGVSGRLRFDIRGWNI